jgi:xylulokinase
LTTLLLGDFALVDAAEGSGTNIMDIQTHLWDKQLLKHCSGDELYSKLDKEPVEGGTILGNVNSYYVKRYGFSPGKNIHRIYTVPFNIDQRLFTLYHLF